MIDPKIDHWIDPQLDLRQGIGQEGTPLIDHKIDPSPSIQDSENLPLPPSTRGMIDP